MDEINLVSAYELFGYGVPRVYLQKTSGTRLSYEQLTDDPVLDTKSIKWTDTQTPNALSNIE